MNLLALVFWNIVKMCGSNKWKKREAEANKFVWNNKDTIKHQLA